MTIYHLPGNIVALDEHRDEIRPALSRALAVNATALMIDEPPPKANRINRRQLIIKVEHGDTVESLEQKLRQEKEMYIEVQNTFRVRHAEQPFVKEHHEYRSIAVFSSSDAGLNMAAGFKGNSANAHAKAIVRFEILPPGVRTSRGAKKMEIEVKAGDTVEILEKKIAEVKEAREVAASGPGRFVDREPRRRGVA